MICTRKGVLRDHLEQTASEIDDWIGGLWEVARRVDTFETDRTIQQDLQSVPVTVRNLEAETPVRSLRTDSTQEPPAGITEEIQDYWQRLQARLWRIPPERPEDVLPWLR
jgi:hypothetical protein